MDFQWAMEQVYEGKRVRRRAWARVTRYTDSTPPLNYELVWRVWKPKDTSLVNGGGGSIGGAADGDPIRNGMTYSATPDDKAADDWELYVSP